MKENYYSKILRDFVFRDCRLGDHPKFRAEFLQYRDNRVVITDGSSSRTAKTLESEMEYISIVSGANIKKTIIVIPINVGKETIGSLELTSKDEVKFNDDDSYFAYLLSTLLAYMALHIEQQIKYPTIASIALGGALRQIRESLGITQEELSKKIKGSRIALSRWEAGAQPPSIGPLYKWCQALGLLDENEKRAIVKVIDITEQLLKTLRENPGQLKQLSPGQFEYLIAERLEKMGLDVTLTGNINQRDGGIDLIAVPKLRSFNSYLIAGQIKHHTGDQRTGREAVDRLLSWKDDRFNFGLLVIESYPGFVTFETIKFQS